MKLALGIVIGILLVLAGEYLFLTQGGMPVAARGGKPLPLERFLTSKALHVATVKEAGRSAPFAADEQNLLGGARIYREHCALCHGRPGERPSALAAGMFPRPPQLWTKDGMVTDDPVGETWWKVRNGIRLTGMPGFEGALTDTAIWQVSLLLANAEHLPPVVGDALRR